MTIDFFKHLLRDKVSLLGLIIIILIMIIGLFAPWFAPHDPIQINLGQTLMKSCREYPLGTDHLGRCILSRIIYGTRVSLSTSFLVLTIIMSVGIGVGTYAGYAGKKMDNIIVSIMDILLAFPGLILALAIAGILGPSITNVMIAIAAVHWVKYARIIRGMVISIKEKEYVLAARASGTRPIRIVFQHILPNIVSPVIVLATLDMGSVLLTISGLSFLGLGAQPPMPEWGAMLNDGRPYIQVAPWLMVFPGLAILTAVLAFNLMGDGLRDLFDPRDIRRI
jgi:peptide/nickel transport system permease protein